MELDATLRKGFRLGEWDIRPIEGLLSGAEGVRHLQPRTMDVLVCLAGRCGEVMTRDELIERVWNGHAVSDEPLTRCIHEIRRALGDHRGEARYIRTIPKRGYQLLQDVAGLLPPVAAAVTQPVAAPAVCEPAVSPQPESSAADVSRRLPEANADQRPVNNLFWEVTRQRVLWVGAVYAALAWVFVQLVRYAELQTTAGRAFPDWLVPALVSIILLGFPIAIFFAWVRQIAIDRPGRARAPDLSLDNVAALLWSRRGIDVVLVTLVITGLAGFALDFSPPAAANVAGAGRKSIAVMPFTDASNKGDAAWLVIGLAEDLRLRLQDYAALDIREPDEQAVAAADQLDAQQLGQMLDVQYVLEGVVVPGENGLRISARLTDTATGFELWSGYFSRTASELASSQQQVVSEVVATLAVGKSHVGVSALPWATEIDGPAYTGYLQALYNLGDSRDVDAAGRAAAWFDRALADDERLAVAHVGLCRAYTRELEIGASAWARGKAGEVCAKAVRELPNQAAAHLAQADYFRLAGLSRDAIDRYEWVTAEQPDSADAWRGLGEARHAERITNGAEEALREALALRPRDARTVAAYTRFLLAERRYADAVGVARTLVQLDRNSSSAYALFAQALLYNGEFPAAIQAGRQAVAHDLGNRDAMLTIAGGYYYQGNYARAGRIYQQAIRLLPDDPAVAGAMANALAQTSEPGAAERARQAYARARTLAEDSLDGASAVEAKLAVAFYCAVLGDIPCAEQYRATAAEAGLDSDEQYYWAALVNTQLGDIEAASAAAQAALKRGYPQALMLSDPLLAPVWSQIDIASIIGGPFAAVHY